MWHMQSAKPEDTAARQDDSQPAVSRMVPLPDPSEIRKGRAAGTTPAQVGTDFQTAFEHILLHGTDTMQMLLGAAHEMVLILFDRCTTFMSSVPTVSYDDSYAGITIPICCHLTT